MSRDREKWEHRWTAAAAVTGLVWEEAPDRFAALIAESVKNPIPGGTR
jgi:hypothetical protein